MIIVLFNLVVNLNLRECFVKMAKYYKDVYKIITEEYL